MNEKEFLILIEAHKGVLYKVSRMYMDSEVDQEDLRQDIIFQLWKSIDKFKGDSQFSSWMYRVAINTSITFFKKDKRRPDKSEIKPNLDIVDDAEGEDKESQLAHFYQAVKTLNKIEKAIILLFIEGYSHNDIAKQLGLSSGNTRVKLNRIKQKVKELIKTQGYEF
jgi:RNA polymerase sigma-70 factor (ECF subfamily)